MRFEEILPKLKEGYNIRRKSWPEGNFYYLRGNDIIILYEQKAIGIAVRSSEEVIKTIDILADDWEMLYGSMIIALYELLEDKLSKITEKYKSTLLIDPIVDLINKQLVDISDKIKRDLCIKVDIYAIIQDSVEPHEISLEVKIEDPIIRLGFIDYCNTHSNSILNNGNII